MDTCGSGGKWPEEKPGGRDEEQCPTQRTLVQRMNWVWRQGQTTQVLLSAGRNLDLTLQHWEPWGKKVALRWFESGLWLQMDSG